MCCQTPLTSLASRPSTIGFSAWVTKWAMLEWARPWCDSPQPTRPPAVVTLTITASRLRVRPTPRRTLFSGGTGKDVAQAWMSAMAKSAFALASVMTCLLHAALERLLEDKLKKASISGQLILNYPSHHLN